MKLDAELSKSLRMSAIEEALKRSGADPNTVLRASGRRNCLDRVKIPMRLDVGCPCGRVATTYFMCLFIVMIIDIINFFKYAILTIETFQYEENYPEIISVQVYVKLGMIGLVAACEALVISNRGYWNLCKVAYALKLMQIIFSLY